MFDLLVAPLENSVVTGKLTGVAQLDLFLARSNDDLTYAEHTAFYCALFEADPS